MRIKSDNGNPMVEVNILCDAKKSCLSISFSVPEKRPGTSSDSFSVLEFEIDSLFADGPEKAATVLGKMILNLFQELIPDGIGYDNKDTTEALAYVDKLMLERANENDPSAQNFIASKYLSDSVEKCDESLLELADEWYKKSAGTGDEKSNSFYLETWPSLKETYRKEILKRKK